MEKTLKNKTKDYVEEDRLGRIISIDWENLSRLKSVAEAFTPYETVFDHILEHLNKKGRLVPNDSLEKGYSFYNENIFLPQHSSGTTYKFKKIIDAKEYAESFYESAEYRLKKE